MNQRISKRIRKMAEIQTVGQSKRLTRKTYRILKNQYKVAKKKSPSPKIKMTRRQKRMAEAA